MAFAAETGLGGKIDQADTVAAAAAQGLLPAAVAAVAVAILTLDPVADFVLPAEQGQVCKLLPAAKQLFIARLEAKMSAPLACAEGSGKTSLFRMMRAQVARYARAVAGGPPYQSFRVA